LALVLQIRDWLALEEEMLRQQAVVVGEVGEIQQVLDKQRVSRRDGNASGKNMSL